MNDVNLNSPDLKLVRPDARAPAKALSSSQGEGSKVSDLAPSSAGQPAQTRSTQQSSEPGNAERLQARHEEQREELGEAVTQLNDFVQNVQRDLQFEVDHEAGQTIVKVVDQQTQKVIRQIPDEVAMRLAENLQQDEPLTLLNIRV